MNVNSLLPHEAQANQNAVSLQLEKKWEKTGLLEGLNNEVERKGMAVLLENQAKQLVTEASGTGTDSNSEEWAGVALPLVRRIFAEIAAKDFVSVQPMNLPSGLVFYLDFKYGTGQNATGFNSSDGNDFLTSQGRTSQLDSVFGVTDKSRGNGTNTAVEGLYGAGRFGYSINDVSATVEYGETTVLARTGSVNTSTGLFAEGGTNASMTATEFGIFTNFNTDFSASNAGTNFRVVSVPSASLSGFDPEGVRGFNISGSGITAVFPEFTRITSNNSHVEFLVAFDTTGDGAAKADKVAIAYHKQPTDITRGDFESDLDGGTSNETIDIPEINLEMRSEAIVAKTRKLKAVWSPDSLKT